MPVISRNYSEVVFSETILDFTIVTFVGYFLIYSLGDTFLARVRDISNTVCMFESIFRIIILLLLLCTLVCIALSMLNYIVLFLILLLSFLRIWAEYIYRYEEMYKKILQQNIFYFLGSLLILLPVNSTFKDPLMYFFLAEIFALAIYYRKINSIFIWNFTLDKKILKDYTIYSIQYGINNLIAHGDRLFLYALFSPYILNSYFALTVSSKCLYLIITPVRAVLASMLAKTSDKDRDDIIEYLLRITKKLFVVLFFIACLGAFSALYFLYFQYLDSNLKNIVLVSLATSIGCLSTLYHMVCMRYLEAEKLLSISILKFIVLLLLGYPMIIYFEIRGFLISLLIANILMMIYYWLVIKNIK